MKLDIKHLSQKELIGLIKWAEKEIKEYKGFIKLIKKQYDNNKKR